MENNELIELFNRNNISAQQIAYEEMDIPSNYVFSPIVEAQKNLYEEVYKEYINHPKNKERLPINDKMKDESFKSVYENYRNSIPPHTAQKNDYLESLGIGPMELVHEKGDREGGGEYSEKVFFLPLHNKYIKITGFYSSYNGTDWNPTIQIVLPEQKTITIYK